MSETSREAGFSSGGWLVANALVAVGLVVLITDRVLRTVYPLSWGGPNIGGGFIVLLAVLAVVTGLVMLVGYGINRSRARRAGPAHFVEPGAATTGEHARRRPGLGRGRGVLPLAVNGVLAVAWAVALIVLPGDSGNAGTNGSVGVTVDSLGAPVLVLQICRGSVDTVQIVGPNRGSQPNELFAQLTAPTALTAPTEVDILHPPSGWSGAPAALPLSAAPQLLLIASAHGEQSRLRQVTFTGAELASLNSGTVQYSIGGRTQRVPAADFAGAACQNL